MRRLMSLFLLASFALALASGIAVFEKYDGDGNRVTINVTELAGARRAARLKAAMASTSAVTVTRSRVCDLVWSGLARSPRTLDSSSVTVSDFLSMESLLRV